MIQAGPFSEIVKTGLYFSIEEDDRVFTGDLFFDFVKKEFQIRGIPSWEGRRTHIIPVAERGPIVLMMLVGPIIEQAARPDGKHSDLRFLKAKVASSFITWLEEWYGDRVVMDTATQHWEIQPNLLWVKS